MLDLDEFGEALSTGRLSTDTARDALNRWQQFLDVYLHERHHASGGRFPDFPPRRLAPLMARPGSRRQIG